MTNGTTEPLTTMLRDAWAMEHAIANMLKRQAEAPDTSPHVRDIASIHLLETTRHIETVASCLEQVAGSCPTLKRGGNLTDKVFDDALSNLTRDHRVRDLLTLQAAEYFEIGCYEALKAAARQSHPEVAAACHGILEDEKRMARWLEQNVSEVVAGYLSEPPPAAVEDTPAGWQEPLAHGTSHPAAKATTPVKKTGTSKVSVRTAPGGSSGRSPAKMR